MKMAKYVIEKFLSSSTIQNDHGNSETQKRTCVRRSPRSTKNSIEKKLEKDRRLRRANKRTNEFFDIDIDSNAGSIDKEFYEVFLIQYRQLLTKKSTSVECYYIVLNSLHKYFTDAGDLDSQNRSSDEFLRSFLLKDFSVDSAETVSDKRQLECELLILIEIHLLRRYPIPINQTKIFARLRILYFITDPSVVKKFTDEILCDEFIDDLTFYLVAIYEELELEMPFDLKKILQDEVISSSCSVESNINIDFASNISNERLRIFFENEKTALDLQAPCTLSSTEETRPKRTTYKKLLRKTGLKSYHKSPSKYFQKVKPACNTPATKQNVFEQHIDGDEIIDQTPIGKIRQNGSSSETRKIAELLRNEELNLISKSNTSTKNPNTQPLKTIIENDVHDDVIKVDPCLLGHENKCYSNGSSGRNTPNSLKSVKRKINYSSFTFPSLRRS